MENYKKTSSFEIVKYFYFCQSVVDIAAKPQVGFVESSSSYQRDTFFGQFFTVFFSVVKWGGGMQQFCKLGLQWTGRPAPRGPARSPFIAGH